MHLRKSSQLSLSLAWINESEKKKKKDLLLHFSVFKVSFRHSAVLSYAFSEAPFVLLSNLTTPLYSVITESRRGSYSRWDNSAREPSLLLSPHQVLNPAVFMCEDKSETFTRKLTPSFAVIKFNKITKTESMQMYFIGCGNDLQLPFNSGNHTNV